MAYDLTYDVEDIGEFFGAEFACKVYFYAVERGYDWQIDITHVDLWQLSVLPTIGKDGRIHSRIVKERCDVPAWLWQIIARNYHGAMVAEAEIAQADARRDELTDRELRGAM